MDNALRMRIQEVIDANVGKGKLHPTYTELHRVVKNVQGLPLTRSYLGFPFDELLPVLVPLVGAENMKTRKDAKMLVLTRKPQERVYIGDNVIITVVSIDKEGRNVRLGFEAPREVAIHREEVYNATQKNRKPETK